MHATCSHDRSEVLIKMLVFDIVSSHNDKSMQQSENGVVNYNLSHLWWHDVVNFGSQMAKVGPEFGHT